MTFYPEHGGFSGLKEVRADFSANINPLGMPESAKRAVMASASAWERYPDPDCTGLREALARAACCDAEQIAVGSGSADLIFRIVSAFRPRKALVAVPAFTEYEKALRQSGCGIVYHLLKQENLFDITDEIMSTIDDQTELVFLCSPSNPAGRLIDPDLLRRIAGRCAQCDVLLIMDECFLPFAADARHRSALNLFADDAVRDHVIVLSAFTKIFAMPGLRLGFAFCGSAAHARTISRTGQFWSVSVPAMAAGEALLQDPGTDDYIRQSRMLIARERNFLAEALREAGFTVIPSEANFLLCRSDRPLYEILLKDGILIRDGSNFTGLSPGWVRIAVRTHEENEELLRGIRRVFT